MNQQYARRSASAHLGGCASIALGIVVLAGWVTQIGPLMTVLPGRIAMKPNTAVAFLCAGIALVLLARPYDSSRFRASALIPAAFVIAIGLISLVEYSTHSDFLIDQLLFNDRIQHPYPGRMAPITALNFCLTGTSLLLLSISERYARWAQITSLLTGFSATLAIVGYIYGVPLLYGSVQYTSMALHTGLGFLILSAAVLHCRSSLGLMAVISSGYAGGWLARRLLPAAVVAPTLFGAIFLHTQTAPPQMRLPFACLIVGQIVLFVILVWTLAYMLNCLENEKNAAQNALQRSEQLLGQRYRTMFEEAVVGIFQSTPDGRLLTVNLAMARMFGYDSPEEMTRATDAARLYVDPTRRDVLGTALQQKGALRNFECQVFRKDGSKIWVSSNIRAVHENGTMIRYEGTNSDITERKLLEEQLAQSQKMEAVGRLAGGVAHDFNNAIGVVVGYSTLLKERVPNDGKALHYTEEIMNAGRRAASLTRQLLAFSRKQVIQPALLDLNAVMSNTEKMLRRLIGEDIAMTVTLEPSLGCIVADRGQLEQVLMNLAVNARDAMPQGGRLIIETFNARLDEAILAQHPYAKPGEYVVLSVSDTGCGMDKETQTHIFEPFFTTKDISKGTGLGLSTVYGIVKQSGGYIWVYSEPERGARFKIYWPRTAQSGHPAQAVHSPSGLPGGSETILLVEDDDAMRELTCKCLAAVGYNVLTAQDGEVAIRVCSRHDGPIHVLLTDVVMPGISGRQLSNSLAALRPELKVLYMSGYTADLIADHGVLESNMALLEKPFTQELLLNKLRSVLDSSLAAGMAGAG
jgi:two-component system, cell cycle sensor histidine kinase and response regulator CckA